MNPTLLAAICTLGVSWVVGVSGALIALLVKVSGLDEKLETLITSAPVGHPAPARRIARR